MVWICRDPSLIEFHLDAHAFGATGWTLVYYTGKTRALALKSECVAVLDARRG